LNASCRSSVVANPASVLAVPRRKALAADGRCS